MRLENHPQKDPFHETSNTIDAIALAKALFFDIITVY